MDDIEFFYAVLLTGLMSSTIIILLLEILI